MENFDYFYYTAGIAHGRSIACNFVVSSFSGIFVFFFHFLFSPFLNCAVLHFLAFIPFSTSVHYLFHLNNKHFSLLFKRNFIHSLIQSVSRFVCVRVLVYLSVFLPNQNMPCTDMQYILYHRNTDKNNKINQ